MSPFTSRLLCPLLRYEQPLALIGLWWVSHTLFHWTLSTLSGIRYYVLAQLFSRSDYRRYGRWAVVLVERDTLSFYYAEELARKHMDILIVGPATEEETLTEFAEYLKNRFNVTAEVLCYDPDDPMVSLQEKIESLDKIGVLVNQIPARPLPGPHAYMEDCVVSSVILTIHVMTNLSKIVIRKMAAQQSGFVVNISDTSCEYPHAYIAAHSAACAYMDMFSRSLCREVSCENVYVQSLTPYPCTMVSPDLCTWSSVPPRLIARHAVNGIGKARSRGYWAHGVKGFLASCVPVCLRTYWWYLRNRPKCCSLMALDY